jgi:hypothetical protein
MEIITTNSACKGFMARVDLTELSQMVRTLSTRHGA